MPAAGTAIVKYAEHWVTSRPGVGVGAELVSQAQTAGLGRHGSLRVGDTL
jgi:hypothetical protein